MGVIQILDRQFSGLLHNSSERLSLQIARGGLQILFCVLKELKQINLTTIRPEINRI